MAEAQGKAILLGEHAVVYGVPAIAIGLERGAHASAKAASPPTLRIESRRAAASDGTEVGTAYAALLESLGARDVATEVTLELPPGAGLGASAAIAVAAARAVLDAVEPAEPSARAAEAERSRASRVLEAAMAWERVFHGNPSGIDAWAAAFGGCFRFVREMGMKPLVVGAPLRLAIAVAGPPASTREMVENVAKLRARRPEVVEKALEGIRSLVENAALCIEAGDAVGLGKLLDLNQMLLSGLFLSTPAIENACAIARNAGALGAKLTGAGGGGCVIALGSPETRSILAAWRAQGLECFESVVKKTEPGEDGAP